MAWHETLTIPRETWTLLSDPSLAAGINSIRIGSTRRGSIIVNLSGSATTPPADEEGAIRINFSEEEFVPLYLSEMFAGIPAPAHVWAYSAEACEVSVSHDALGQIYAPGGGGSTPPPATATVFTGVTRTDRTVASGATVAGVAVNASRLFLEVVNYGARPVNITFATGSFLLPAQSIWSQPFRYTGAVGLSAPATNGIAVNVSIYEYV